MTDPIVPTSPWEPVELAEGQKARWQIGPLTLWGHRAAGDWELLRTSGDDPLDETSGICSGWPEPPPETAKRIRCGAAEGQQSIRLIPSLADRPVVARPEHPLTVLPGDEVVLFVGSQLWVRIEVHQVISTLPTFRQSDTWFGRNTREGELCYAVRTRAAMRLADVPVRPARALTRIQVVNKGSEPLLLERIKVPVPALTLFVGEDGRHWTQDLSVRRGSEPGAVEVKIGTGPPQAAGEVSQISAGRHSGGSVLRRAFGALIG